MYLGIKVNLVPHSTKKNGIYKKKYYAEYEGQETHVLCTVVSFPWGIIESIFLIQYTTHVFYLHLKCQSKQNILILYQAALEDLQHH